MQEKHRPRQLAIIYFSTPRAHKSGCFCFLHQCCYSINLCLVFMLDLFFSLVFASVLVVIFAQRKRREMGWQSLVIDAWIREAEEASKLVEDLGTKYKNKSPEQWRLRDNGLSKLLGLGVKLDRLESLLRNPPSKPIL